MTQPIPISIICGSLGAVSANRSALDVAVRSLTDFSAGIVEWAPSIDSLGVFRPELADDPPSEVVAFQRSVERSAGVRADPVETLRQVSETILPFGIDPERFGNLT